MFKGNYYNKLLSCVNMLTTIHREQKFQITGVVGVGDVGILKSTFVMHDKGNKLLAYYLTMFIDWGCH